MSHPQALDSNTQPSLDVAAGPPFIQVSGYTLVGNPITGPRDTYENVFDYSGSLSWVRGKHALKFGGGYQYQQINVLQGIATNGFFVFAPFPVTDAFASFLTGQPVVFLQGIGDFSRNIRGNNANGYVQDTYKVAPRLTINAGLRYELPVPSTELQNRVSLFEPGKQSTVMPDAPAGLLYPGDSGVPAGLIPTDYKAFAPRVGIAWDPSSDGKTLITSAYGIFYEPYYTGQGGPLQAPISAPPFLGTPQVSLPNFADPFNGNPPAPGTFSKPLTNLTLSPTLTLPYTQDWDLNMQQSFGPIGCSRSDTSAPRERACLALSKRTQRCSFPEPWTASQFRIRAMPINGGFIPAARSPIRRAVASIHLPARSRASPIRRITRWKRRCASDSATGCHSSCRTHGRRRSTMFRHST